MQRKKIRTRFLMKIKSAPLDIQSWLQPSREDGEALGRGCEGVCALCSLCVFQDGLIFWCANMVSSETHS